MIFHGRYEDGRSDILALAGGLSCLAMLPMSGEPPNTMLKHIHNRMPVIYYQAMGKQWLEGVGSSSTMTLDTILRPWPPQYMMAHEVSTMVNVPANDRPECIAPIRGGQVLDGQDY